MKKKIYKIIGFCSVILLLLESTSCSTTNDTLEENSGYATVKVNLKGTSFEDELQLGNLASVNGLASNKQQFQIVDLKGNDDFQIKAELTPVNNSNNIEQVTAVNINPVAATETNALKIGIKYKLVVYAEDGSYVMEQDYTSGQEANIPAITALKAESTYNFVVYSIGSITDLPVITYTDPNKKTLATASVNNVTGDSDPMYFSKIMKISGSSPNYLDVILKHLSSQIIVSVNSSATVYFTINDISGVSITPHNNAMNLKLSDGSTSPFGLVSNGKVVTFAKTAPATTITASPVLINTQAVTNGNIVIKSLTLKYGTLMGITHQNITLGNLKITPGVKYNLKLSLVRKDAYLTYKGYPAVRLNGLIWMRHNLGADINLDADTPVQGLLGNYYQFGRSTVAANASTTATVITPWDTTAAPDNAWNTGTGDVPVKTVTDPCPAGWRVPNMYELALTLLNNTRSSIGTPNESPTNYSVANVLTSSTYPGIKMTFPASGARRNSDGILISRGIVNGELYWSSNINGTDGVGVNINTLQGVFYNRSNAFPIRCIAESPF